MAVAKASFAKVSGLFVGHIMGITLLFCIVAGAAVGLDQFVKVIEPLNVKIPYFIAILGIVEAAVFYLDVLLFFVGVLVAGALYVKELKRCF